MALEHDRHALSVYAFWQSIFPQSRQSFGIGETKFMHGPKLSKEALVSLEDLHP
jgi:hypothetical protein